MIAGDEAWQAVLRRDRRFDGRFFTGVHQKVRVEFFPRPT